MVACLIVAGGVVGVVVGGSKKSACAVVDPLSRVVAGASEEALRSSLGSIQKTMGLGQCAEPTEIISFDGPPGGALDHKIWNHEVGGNGWGNRELQTYTASLGNSHVDGDGNLVISARRENGTESDRIAASYTSARITTEGKVEVPPGSYVEVWLRAPVGEGVWPGFWLMGANRREAGWPAAGELDVMEATGSSPTKVRQTIHMASRDDASRDMPYGENVAGSSTTFAAPIDTQFHAYGVYFDVSVVRFYVDRQQRFSMTAEHAVTSGRSWPFGKPQYLLLNVAIGGIAGSPAATGFPREMTVAHIAIWQAADASLPRDGL